MSSIDAVVMGRSTFEVARAHPGAQDREGGGGGRDQGMDPAPCAIYMGPCALDPWALYMGVLWPCYPLVWPHYPLV